MKIANVLNSASWGSLSPDILEKGVGGREGAMIQLSQEWAKQSIEVTNFCNVEKSSRFYEEGGYYEFVPLNITNKTLENFPYDVVIAWECPSLFNNESLRNNVGLKLTHLQCADFPSDQEMHYAGQYCDYTVVLSNWAKEYILNKGIEVTEDKVLIKPNGIRTSRYSFNPKKLVKGAWRFVYSSSPDRGLLHILNMWPDIRKLNPDAELVVTYGVDKWTSTVKWHHNKQAIMALDIEKGMKQEGIVDFGKVGQGRLSKLQQTATAWLYPLDAIQGTETGCITAIENMAAGNPCIISDGDCMEEEFGEAAYICPLPFNKNDYLNGLQEIMNDPEMYSGMQQAGFELASKRDWSDIAEEWMDLFYNELRSDKALATHG